VLALLKSFDDGFDKPIDDSSRVRFCQSRRLGDAPHDISLGQGPAPPLFVVF
jgi:hypothetical protein